MARPPTPLTDDQRAAVDVVARHARRLAKAQADLDAAIHAAGDLGTPHIAIANAAGKDRTSIFRLLRRTTS